MKHLYLLLRLHGGQILDLAAKNYNAVDRRAMESFDAIEHVGGFGLETGWRWYIRARRTGQAWRWFALGPRRDKTLWAGQVCRPDREMWLKYDERSASIARCAKAALRIKAKLLAERRLHGG